MTTVIEMSFDKTIAPQLIACAQPTQPTAQSPPYQRNNDGDYFDGSIMFPLNGCTYKFSYCTAKHLPYNKRGAITLSRALGYSHVVSSHISGTVMFEKYVNGTCVDACDADIQNIMLATEKFPTSAKSIFWKVINTICHC
jgi:hypothetical protein